MRLIDGNRIVMSLADWWYSSFGQEETEESKAIKKVMDQVEKMVMEMPEIVRCKDCIDNDVNCGGEENWCLKFEYDVDDDGYCNYGEKQVTGKLNNPDDSLIREDSEACKEQESKLVSDLISRQVAIEAMEPFDTNHELRDTLEGLPSVGDMGEVSDGYHTFNQLYHQRAVLFATIVNQNKDKAWKSWKHEDGKFCFDKEGEWFIVGVDTPEGSYTYHYEQKYWDMFDCEELDNGKHWDGHTEDDVTRLLSLPPVEPKPVCEDAISRADTLKALCAECDVKCEDGTDKEAYCTEYAVIKSMPPVEPKRPKGEWKLVDHLWECNRCQYRQNKSKPTNFCPNCGADCRGDKE